MLKHKQIQTCKTSNHSVLRTFRAASALLLSNVRLMRLGQRSTCDFCDMNVSQARVTQTCLGMCACVRLCMRAAPLSSPDATPVCLCPEV